MSTETVEFSHLIISLAQSVKEGLGEEGTEKPQNKPMAKYSLETLQMLKVKTQGNLTESELKLLEALLDEFSGKFEAS